MFTKLVARDNTQFKCQIKLLAVKLNPEGFFFLVWAVSPPPSAKMPWGYLSVKVLLYNGKKNCL